MTTTVLPRARRLPIGPTAALVVLGALFAIPSLVGPTATTYATRILIGALFAHSFNVLWSHARLLSFGHAAYFGCGGFAVIHLMRALEHSQFMWPTPLIPAIGLVIGVAVGLVIGYLATARTGVYFAMITLAIGELFYTIAPKWESMFGGEAGLSSMRLSWLSVDFARPDQVYYVVLIWTAVGIAALWYFSRTIFGRLGMAIGDDEGRLVFLGVNTRAIKTILFAISAAMAGLAGGLLTFATESIGYEIFAGASSAAPVMHTFIGGANVFFGPSIGAAFMMLFGQVTSDISRNWLMYQGAAFIVVILALPSGLSGGLLSLFRGDLPSRGAQLRSFLQVVAGAVTFAFGLIVFAEILQRHGGSGLLGKSSGLKVFGYHFDPSTSSLWIIGAMLALAGFGMIVEGRKYMAANK